MPDWISKLFFYSQSIGKEKKGVKGKRLFPVNDLPLDHGHFHVNRWLVFWRDFDQVFFEHSNIGSFSGTDGTQGGFPA
jgi:hypothetical protein